MRNSAANSYFLVKTILHILNCLCFLDNKYNNFILLDAKYNADWLVMMAILDKLQYLVNIPRKYVISHNRNIPQPILQERSHV